MSGDEAIARLVAEQQDAWAAYRDALGRRLDLDPHEAAVALHLALAGRVSAERLSAALVLPAGEAAAVLEDLVARGLLVRTAGELELAPLALERVAQAAEPLMRDLDAVADALSPRERSIVGRFLEEVVAVGERRADELARRALDGG
jgi:hypothetical protein